MFWWWMLVILFVVGVVLIVQPLFGAAEDWGTDVVDQDIVKRLRRDKAKLLRQLKDLEFERDAGNLEDDEFATLRQRTLSDAALVHRQLEAITGSSTPRSVAPPRLVSESTGDADRATSSGHTEDR